MRAIFERMACAQPEVARCFNQALDREFPTPGEDGSDWPFYGCIICLGEKIMEDRVREVENKLTKLEASISTSRWWAAVIGALIVGFMGATSFYTIPYPLCLPARKLLYWQWIFHNYSAADFHIENIFF